MFLKETSTKSFAEIEDLIQRAFAEDCVHHDLTTLACIPEGTHAQARLILKQKGCIAGLKFIPWLFSLCDPEIDTQIFVRDGQMCASDTILALIDGPAQSLLSVERVALNFLKHLSGIATLTAHCVAQSTCPIVATRQTHPGLRAMQNYAVRTGGGAHFSDRILIQNNHMTLTPLTDCIRRARAKYPFSSIQVEIDSVDLLEHAISAGVNALLFVNMSPEQVRECVVRTRKRVYLEASISALDQLSALAATGVDGISIGALTHSAPVLDISMRIA